jgi:hypothetical protein
MLALSGEDSHGREMNHWGRCSSFRFWARESGSSRSVQRNGITVRNAADPFASTQGQLRVSGPEVAIGISWILQRGRQSLSLLESERTIHKRLVRYHGNKGLSDSPVGT